MPVLLSLVLGLVAGILLFVVPDMLVVLGDMRVFFLKALVSLALFACGAAGTRAKERGWSTVAFAAGGSLLALATLNLAIRIGELGTY